MIKLHFYLQSALGVGAILLALPMVFGYGTLIFLLYWQLLVGVVQYPSSWLLILREKTRTKEGMAHLGLSTLCLLVLYLLPENGDVPVTGFFMLVLPWVLAALHWFVSYKLFLIEKR